MTGEPVPARRDRSGAAPELTSSHGTARDSLVVGACTMVGRITGVARVVVVGAVLGPSFLGNTYQVTNTLPNLIYYGFLAGSLFCSLLVPALVAHVDDRRPGETARVAGGFLGVAGAVLALLAPLAVLAVPELFRLATLGVAAPTADQVGLARLLLATTVPQVLCYAVVGSATAVMYAHRRFVLPAAAPAVENLGVIAVLLAVHLRYGGAWLADLGAAPTGAVLLLGLGSTGAVVLHAAVQWWGAHRSGVTLLPRPGWRDPEVRRVVARALRSLGQAGLLAVQTLALLLVADRVAGGSVALQMALNFYYLPLALVATPVGIALLPRLSRLTGTALTDTFLDGLRLTVFLVVPATFGYVVLAGPLSDLVAAGRMAGPGAVAMVAGGVAWLAVGLAGEAVFFVTTQAAYAREDTRTPLRSMALQTAVCLAGCVVAAVAAGGHVVSAVAAAFSAGSLLGGAHVLRRVLRTLPAGSAPLWPTLLRALAAAAAMAVVVRVVVDLLSAHVAGEPGLVLALAAGTVVGLGCYLGGQAAMRAPELGWLRGGLRAPRPAEAAL